MQKKTIPVEYLRLRLEQVMAAAGSPAPKRGDVEISLVLDAIRALARQIAERDAKQRRDERAWLREQVAKLPKPRRVR